MSAATCWNCQAPVSGPVCQRCGAAQAPNAAQVPPYAQSGPAHQPIVSQASMSIRPQQPPASGAPMYGPGGQPMYPQGSQPGSPASGQPMYGPGGQPMYGPGSQPGAPGYPGSGAYQQPGGGYGPGQGMPAQPYAPATSQRSGAQPASLVEALPLGVIGGLVGGVIGALIWAFVIQLSHYDISFIAIGIGFLVGLGVALGARVRFHISLSLLAAALGLLSFLLGLYFLMSLGLSDSLGEGLNIFALSPSDFFSFLGGFLKANSFFYLYFALIPFVAAGTTFRLLTANRTVRRRR